MWEPPQGCWGESCSFPLHPSPASCLLRGSPGASRTGQEGDQSTMVAGLHLCPGWGTSTQHLESQGGQVAGPQRQNVKRDAIERKVLCLSIIIIINTNFS